MNPIRTFWITLFAAWLCGSCATLIETPEQRWNRLPERPKLGLIGLGVPQKTTFWERFKAKFSFPPPGPTAPESVHWPHERKQIAAISQGERQDFYGIWLEEIDWRLAHSGKDLYDYVPLAKMQRKELHDPFEYRRDLAERNRLDLLVAPALLGGPYERAQDPVHWDIPYGPLVVFYFYDRDGGLIDSRLVWNLFSFEGEAPPERLKRQAIYRLLAAQAVLRFHRFRSGETQVPTAIPQLVRFPDWVRQSKAN